MRELLAAEFGEPPTFPVPAASASRRGGPIPAPVIPMDAAPPRAQPPEGLAGFVERGVGDAVWRREWLRRWRRFQLPDQMLAFYQELGRAQTVQQVYDALAEHAVRIVGGFTCVVFPAQQAAAPLRPIPNSRLGLAADQLSLPAAPSLPRMQPIAADAALANDSPFAGLRPLFADERAVSLAHAPLESGGVVMVVERRHERVFEEEDWTLLRTLATQAEAALERVRLFNGVASLAQTDPATGLAGPGRIPALMEHARVAAERGIPVTEVEIGLPAADAKPTAAQADERLRAVAEALREETREFGLAARRADGDFMLLLPDTGVGEARAIIERVRVRLGAELGIRARIAPFIPMPATGTAPAGRPAEAALCSTHSPRCDQGSF